MREILFRGKTEKGEWVEGDLLRFKNLGMCVIWQSNSGKHIIPKTIGQFTGLTDKNGRRIFEGDILKYKYTTCEETICVACWVDEYAMFSNHVVISEAKNFSNGTHFSNSEVIGNIHDNPELLGGAQQ